MFRAFLTCHTIYVNFVFVQSVSENGLAGKTKEMENKFIYRSFYIEIS